MFMMSLRAGNILPGSVKKRSWNTSAYSRRVMASGLLGHTTALDILAVRSGNYTSRQNLLWALPVVDVGSGRGE
jgi:hypothetical protein